MSQEPSALDRSGPRRPRPPDRQTLLRLAAVLAIAVLAVGVAVFVIRQQLPRDSTTPATSTIDSPADTTPGTAIWNVPQGFLGTWKGTAGDGAHTIDVVLTIIAGKTAEEVATSADTDRLSGDRCERAERVVSLAATELTFAGRATGGVGCPDNGRTTTVELRPDGSLGYQAPGPNGSILVGTLHLS
ncbi:hypothetical protein [Nocardia altamirensis]|uniref:hypothetical protein n=1 Tax=Nocardia altamirensis TaxID=472158 RepID=UPI0008402DB8|nr:hypothetical protein [Nocardia altamirensis]